MADSKRLNDGNKVLFQILYDSLPVEWQAPRVQVENGSSKFGLLAVAARLSS